MNRVRQLKAHLTAAKESKKRDDLDYESVRKRYQDFRDIRLRKDGTKQYESDIDGVRGGAYTKDPYASEVKPRAPFEDTVEVLIIGGGFSALLTSARLREIGVDSIRIVERGGDVGGTWYWNRYPSAACDVPSYDYLPLLEEMDYVPKRLYSQGPEIFQHCRKIADRYKLYDLAVFHTTVTSTVWDEHEKLWLVSSDRGDCMRAKFVIVANGTLSKPKLPAALIDGLESFEGMSWHTSRWNYEYTQQDLSGLAGKRVGIIGTGASAVQVIPEIASATAADGGALFVFQRTPSSIAVRNDRPTDPNWARRLQPGWQAKRRAKGLAAMKGGGGFLTASAEERKRRAAMTEEEKLQRVEQANMRAMARIHARIDEVVTDPITAAALKPHYMIGCKRPCFHDGFLPVFNMPHVTLVDTKGKGIESVGVHGPVFDGRRCTVLTMHCTHHALYSPCTVLTMHCTHHALYSLCTVLTMHCTHYALYSPFTVLTMHCTHYVLYSPCTALTMHCTHYALYSPCTVLTMHCTHHALYSPCTVLTMHCTHHALYSPYCTHHALYSPCTVLTMHCTHHALYSPCTLLTMHCTHHALHYSIYKVPYSPSTVLPMHSITLSIRYPARGADGKPDGRFILWPTGLTWMVSVL
jgi:cation diffusion facilitator CzcD-associated flavoprotein CzcO